MTDQSNPPPGLKYKEQANDPDFLFKQLNSRIRLCSTPDAQQRITAHVRAVTKHNNLVAFINNGSTPTEKAELLKVLLRAVLKNDFSELKGEVPSGQAVAPPVAVVAPEVAKAFGMESMRETLAKTTPAPVAVADKAAAMAALLTQLMAPGEPVKATVDADEVRRIVDEVCKAEIHSARKDLAEENRESVRCLINATQAVIREHLAKIPPRDVVEIRKWDGTVKEIAGLTHKQLPTIIKAVSARTASGWPVPCWWYGAPGAGKTHLWGQVAEALEAKHYPIPLGPTTTEGKLLGYKNLATGEFVTGLLYVPFKSGGFVNLDEIDVADPSVLVGVNSLVANDRFLFPNGECVARHRDFYIVASANTIGTGAMLGFQRNKLDAATLDRFAKFRLEYDRDLETALCGNAGWAEYVWKVREYVEKNCAASLYITPRASINGAALIANGLPAEMVADSTLFAMVSKDIKASIIASVGTFW